MQKPTGSGSTFKHPSYISSSLERKKPSDGSTNLAQMDALVLGKMNSKAGSKLFLPIEIKKN
jgi:hypothetical protein